MTATATPTARVRTPLCYEEHAAFRIARLLRDIQLSNWSHTATGKSVIDSLQDAAGTLEDYANQQYWEAEAESDLRYNGWGFASALTDSERAGTRGYV
jgi:hypothetical protein